MDSRAEITFLLDIDGNNSIYWKLLYSIHTLKIYYFTLQINRTISIFCQGLNGTSIGITGIFYWYLATTWHGIQFSTWYIPGQYRFCFALIHILVITGWPLCNDSSFDSYATGLPSCNNTAPSPTAETSSYNTTSLVVSKYL